MESIYQVHSPMQYTELMQFFEADNESKVVEVDKTTEDFYAIIKVVSL